ncbi:hypothetical protein T02_2232 [Trichinella nativa]|uniref:Uncharacterized protein n=1 Tax=Trichinella nativa TaxID=6335 RepID=A0A0V1KI41_9BILA|nr:hypothetical protein T02_2232 [Trichinella nativa]
MQIRKNLDHQSKSEHQVNCISLSDQFCQLAQLV